MECVDHTEWRKFLQPVVTGLVALMPDLDLAQIYTTIGGVLGTPAALLTHNGILWNK